MLKIRVSRETWWLVGVALLVLGAGLGLRDPWPSDEPRFALVARQMVDSGQWLFPHRGLELYSDKPPMLMWWQATLYHLLGNWRIAFLLPSLVAALVTLWCVHDLGRRLWTRRVGLYAAWALLFTLHFTFQARRAQIDPLVVMFITVANYGLLRHLLRGPCWPAWWLGWCAAGLGVITKGVGALALLMLLPAAVAAAGHWPRVAMHARDARFWLAPLAFVLPIALWLVPVVLAVQAEGSAAYRDYLHDLLFRQTAQRYLQSWDHHAPWWYYLGIVATLWIPPLLLLPWALPAWWRRLRRRDARYLLPLAWCVLVVLFFSIPQGKRDVYILPALPLFCLALAPLLPGLLRRRDVQGGLGLVATALSLLLLAAGAVLLLDPARFEPRLVQARGLAPGVATGVGWTALALAAWGLGSVWLARRRQHLALLSLLAMAWVLQGLVGYGLLNDASSARGLMQHVGQRIGPHAQLGLVGWKEQTLLMADRPAATFGFTVYPPDQLVAGVAWQAAQPRQRWLLVLDEVMLPCVDRRQAEVAGVANRRRWWLVPATAVVSACEVDPQARRDHQRAMRWP